MRYKQVGTWYQPVFLRFYFFLGLFAVKIPLTIGDSDRYFVIFV